VMEKVWGVGVMEKVWGVGVMEKVWGAEWEATRMRWVKERCLHPHAKQTKVVWEEMK
jgi:hypothetical protein